MSIGRELIRILEKHPNIRPLVLFNQVQDKLYPFDFTSKNTQLRQEIFNNTRLFSDWIRNILEKNKCRYGIGGYNEHRTIYSRSELFSADEPRRLHLGVDIWGPVGTPVFVPLDGVVHSYSFNDNFGDYGATIILQHEIEGIKFHTLYGHLNLASIHLIEKNDAVHAGQLLAGFGDLYENGHWPPHLHFQVIADLQNFEGDYPGVCKYSERETYLSNCPDPDIILKHTFG